MLNGLKKYFRYLCNLLLVSTDSPKVVYFLPTLQPLILNIFISSLRRQRFHSISGADVLTFELYF